MKTVLSLWQSARIVLREALSLRKWGGKIGCGKKKTRYESREARGDEWEWTEKGEGAKSR